MDAVPRWTVAEEPSFVVVPNSPGADDQREFDEAAIYPDGRFVVFVGPDQARRESILLHVADPTTDFDFGSVAIIGFTGFAGLIPALRFPPNGI
ncbi:MAG: hypothetical protein OXQ32_08130, partial [bacterium]|nr:hypothetical protein [bacterium]